MRFKFARKMTKTTSVWISCMMCLAVSCTDPVKHEHNFVEVSNADFSFRSPSERREVIADLINWAESSGFVEVAGTPESPQSAYLLEPDPGNPRCFAKLTYQLRDNPDGNQFWVHLYLTTDRWGDKRAHARQKKMTDKIHEALKTRFPFVQSPSTALSP
jgi:hypothetical protein